LVLVRPVSLGLSCIALAAVGWQFLRVRPHVASPVRSGGFGYGLAVSLANPTLIATFTALAAFFQTQGIADLDAASAVPFGVGTCLGMISWFFLLLGLVRRLHHRLTRETLARVCRAVAFGIFGLSLWFGVHAGMAIDLAAVQP
jgi:hypothetical protein